MFIRRILSTKMSTQKLFDTKVLRVKPESIKFSPNAFLDGSLPTILDPNTEVALREAARIIRDTDDTVAFPTETVYGLGGSSLNDDSVLNIYKAKNRPSDNPLISHISSIDQLNRKIYGDTNLHPSELLKHIPKSYHNLINTLWPGPLTILLPVPPHDTNTLSKLTTADQPTFAVRIPSNPVARALIALSDTPIAAPSANASTRPSPTLASHVYHDLQGKIPLILDGGACKVGVESTVVDGLCSPPLLLRPGGFTYEDIRYVGGEFWANCKVESTKSVKADEKVRTPGMKYKHYAPSAKVVLLLPSDDKDKEKKLELFKQLFSKEIHDNPGVQKIAILTTKYLDNIKDSELENYKNCDLIIKTLGHDGEEIQANLFAELRQVDETDKVDLIFVEGIPEEEEGLAVMNRLRKAAANNCIAF